MGFSPEKAAIRFGEGLSPKIAPATTVEDVLRQVTGPDDAAAAYPIAKLSTLFPRMAEIENSRRAFRKARNDPNAEEFRKNYRKSQRRLRRELFLDEAKLFARSITTVAPFRERLTRFWADHFTVIGKNGSTRQAVPHYIEEAIRPHIAGRFSDMLKAVVTNPMMLDYLDQSSSVGPNSIAAGRGKRGLNENLARELLELHTLGVGAGYAQVDVRELAELLTGLSATFERGFLFRVKMAEPGAETVLGETYGGGTANLDDILAALDDLAVHPDTARHIARKLAVHFTSDKPDTGLVDAMASAYLDSGGALLDVYRVMLEHQFTWDSFGQKVKQPVDFVTSAIRALNLPGKSLKQLNRNKLNGFLVGPLTQMGQRPHWPKGPDGWPEEADAWVTPQGLAARLQWSMAAPSAFFRSLPDPREFVEMALGDAADQRVRFAAANAESRREGVGLVLASPAFQRR